jgi:xylose dehydrogenase (NAD/NADP)
MTSTALRIGVLGAAAIARQLIAGVASSTTVRVTTVASRDLAKAKQFAKESGIERACGSYKELLADPEIDAIYIPLPNALHAEWAIRAADAGKHVLCEKPLAMSRAEAVAMFEAARRNGVHLVEAFPYRAQPQTQKLRELIEAKAIGRIQTINSNFGVAFSDPANIRLNAELGGGALLDAGSYAVSLVRLVAGERPARVNATSHGFHGVDRTTVALLEFENGIFAQVSCSFATAYHRHALIAGDEGIIETTYLNHPPIGGAPEIFLRRGVTVNTPRERIETAGGNGFLGEAESFQRLVAHGPAHWTGATPEESIDIAATLEAIAKSAKTRTWVDVEG